MKKQKLFNTAIATAMAAGAVVAVAPTDADAAVKSFKDLKTTDSHYTTIMNLLERNLISGYPGGVFKPNNEIERGHAALIIANVLGLDKTNVTDPGFKDVPKSHPYYGAIAALANKGIIGGYANGSYGVKDTLTRGQMAVIIKNAFDLEANGQTAPFKDIVNHPYKEQITALYANKVTSGKTPTKFDAASAVTRGQLSTFVVKAEEASKANNVVKIIEIKDGQVVTTKGTYDIDPAVAAVFSDKNGAALKDALVGLEIVENKTAVASLNNVVAATSIGRIVGIKSLTIVAGNATFDGGNVSIPNVTVNGDNVVVNNVVADKIEVADGLTVELKGVEAKEIVVTAGTKLTLDPASKIETLVLPKDVKIEDVVTNYNEVKDSITNVKDETGSTVDPGETTNPPIGGGGGGGSTQATAAKSTVDGLITDLLDNTSTIWSDFGTGSSTGFAFNGNHATLGDIKLAIEDKGTDLENAALESITLEDLSHLVKIDDITVTSSPTVKTITIANDISSSTLDEVKSELGALLSPSYVATKLTEFTGLNDQQAAGKSVASFVSEYGNFNIKVTFTDNSSLQYPYTLTIAD